MRNHDSTRCFAPKAIQCAFAVLLVAVAAILLPSSASAYVYSTCSGNKVRWNGRRADMYVSTTSFRVGSSWDTRLQNAMYNWNDVKGAGFNFYVGRDTDGSHNNSNGRTEVYFSNSSELGSALAVTFVRSHCYWFFGYHYGIDETDIGFNASYSWSTGAYSYSNPTKSPYNFESVALHELGHALGLKHEDRRMASMNSYYPNSGPLSQKKYWDPLADDRTGARYLYPDGTGETDVASSTHKRTGTGSSNLTSSSPWAYRGSYATLEYSFSNLGTSTQTFNIGYYLSTNSYISTGDRLLGANYGAWASPGFTGTYSRTLYIPTSVAPGTYYLGMIVDFDNKNGEASESNNAQVAPRPIVIY